MVRKQENWGTVYEVDHRETSMEHTHTLRTPENAPFQEVGGGADSSTNTTSIILYVNGASYDAIAHAPRSGLKSANDSIARLKGRQLNSESGQP